MKKILFIALAMFVVLLANAQQNNSDVKQEAIEDVFMQEGVERGIVATISGPINVTLSGGYAQEEYHLEYSPLIPGAKLVWSIQAPQAYITPWTNHCSVSFYAVGGARLVCDIYDGNTWVGAGTTYINIR